MPASATDELPADLILTHGRLATLDAARPEASALAVRGGRLAAVGDEREVLAHRGPDTAVIDARGRRVIPGLIDSHLHVLRGGLHYNMELRWDGVPSLAEALRRLREQAARTPPPQWVRVVGGWTKFQFAERRMPTLEEINAAAPDTPVFVLHLYDRAWLNAAALRAVGYTKDTPDPPGSVIERDRAGTPTGLLIAKPNAQLLYATLALGPRLPFEDQLNSTRQFQRELNRLGVTSAVDAGGGYQRYPDDYAVIEELARRGETTVRIAYNLFTQRPRQELEDFRAWTRLVRPGDGDAMLRFNGAGEMLVFSAADFEDFLEPRPTLAPSLEADLAAVVTLLVQHRWPFRLHATYDESIGRFLDVFERVDRAASFAGLRWFFDHAETVTARNIDRIAALGGGVAIQHRMAFQGEYFRDRYGEAAARHAPPVRALWASGIPLGAGTDATRVASYNPWLGLYWLVSGRTVGGTQLYGERERMSREEALRLYTERNAWFSGEAGDKGQLAAGQHADFAVLSADFFAVDEERIKDITSDLTVLGGRVVWAAGDFGGMAPPPLPFSPSWSPPGTYAGYAASARSALAALHRRPHRHHPMASCGCFAF
jgi:predicted amidohydrolase YtcJ